MTDYHVAIHDNKDGNLSWQYIVTASSDDDARVEAERVAKVYADEWNGQEWSPSYTVKLCTLEKHLNSLVFRGKVP